MTPGRVPRFGRYLRPPQERPLLPPLPAARVQAPPRAVHAPTALPGDRREAESRNGRYEGQQFSSRVSAAPNLPVPVSRPPFPAPLPASSLPKSPAGGAFPSHQWYFTHLGLTGAGETGLCFD
ncbi:hypothetical protein E2C01_076945 [Portunus trituberculatus]|uniref:Uncharacterized protein n=1 Tax=Portunus trituberculatus TaxID=210409 RepID=A0A5B7IKE4_PORTR|nr:hypothetical protein [Portunus trituberculatus]